MSGYGTKYESLSDLDPIVHGGQKGLACVVAAV